MHDISWYNLYTAQYNQNVILLHYGNVGSETATNPKFPTHSTFPNHLTICLAQRAWRWERIRSTTYQQSSCTMLQPKPKPERQSFRAPRTYITHNLRYCDTCTFCACTAIKNHATWNNIKPWTWTPDSTAPTSEPRQFIVLNLHFNVVYAIASQINASWWPCEVSLFLNSRQLRACFES